MNLYEKVKNLSPKKICVIGDIILDKYTKGRCNRFSPEDLVPILDITEEIYSLGGAGNTANNISKLGSIPYLVGAVGNDLDGERILEMANTNGINGGFIIKDSTRRTTLKERVVGASPHHPSRQIVRIDYENKHYISSDIENKIIGFLSSILNDVDAIVISDYAKGVITENLFRYVVEKASSLKKKLIIDPRSQHTHFYKNAFLVVPNSKEAKEMAVELGFHNVSDISKLGAILKNGLNSNILITRGEEGMSLFAEANHLHIPTDGKKVFDVTGASDTVIAALSVALANNLPIEESARFANYAAGIKVGKIGVAPVSINEVLERLSKT